MPAVKLLEIAASYDRPYRTTARHVKELQEKGLFVKQSPGKQFNEKEVKTLEKLMGFKFRRQQ